MNKSNPESKLLDKAFDALAGLAADARRNGLEEIVLCDAEGKPSQQSKTFANMLVHGIADAGLVQYLLNWLAEAASTAPTYSWGHLENQNGILRLVVNPVKRIDWGCGI